MHFAALSQVGEAMAQPGKYWRGKCQRLAEPDRGGAGGGGGEFRLFLDLRHLWRP